MPIHMTQPCVSLATFKQSLKSYKLPFQKSSFVIIFFNVSVVKRHDSAAYC